MRTDTNGRAAGRLNVGVIERRRSRRRDLHETTNVAVFGTGRHEEWHCGAVLLNAGADGIACRIRDAEVQRLSVGRVLRVVFRIGDERDPFDFQSRVINITEGGTPGYLVVGLEFILDADQPVDRKRLLRTLASACERDD